jgi:hypothetical protein
MNKSDFENVIKKINEDPLCVADKRTFILRRLFRKDGMIVGRESRKRLAMTSQTIRHTMNTFVALFQRVFLCLTYFSLSPSLLLFAKASTTAFVSGISRTMCLSEKPFDFVSL